MRGQRLSFFDEAKYRQYLRTLVSSRRRIVYAADFNATATHIATGNSAGLVNVFDINEANRGDLVDPVPVCQQQVESRLPVDQVASTFLGGTVYALYTDIYSGMLYCGTETGICGYKWEDVLEGKGSDEKSKPVFSHTVQAKPGLSSGLARDERIEVNAIAGSTRECVYAGTGIGTVECYTSDNLGWIGRFEGGGPNGYVHCITMLGRSEENSFATGGDDGMVRVYDRRLSHDPRIVLDLRKLTLSRSTAWVGCIASDFDGRFLFCGDGNRQLTSIHVESGRVLEKNQLDFVPNSLVYHMDELYCGGSDSLHGPGKESVLRRFSMSCEEIASCPTSVSGVYALSLHSTSGCMAAAGYSTKHRWHDTTELVDVYLNPPVRSFSVAATIVN